MDKEYNKDEMREWEKECLDMYGYYIHIVDDAYDCGLINAHTHGFESNFDSLNFELLLPLDNDTIKSIFKNIKNIIIDGLTFIDGNKYYSIIKDHPVMIIKRRDMMNTEDIYRIIFPDKNGLFPGDEGCSELYEQQIIL